MDDSRAADCLARACLSAVAPRTVFPRIPAAKAVPGEKAGLGAKVARMIRAGRTILVVDLGGVLGSILKDWVLDATRAGHRTFSNLAVASLEVGAREAPHLAAWSLAV